MNLWNFPLVCLYRRLEEKLFASFLFLKTLSYMDAFRLPSKSFVLCERVLFRRQFLCFPQRLLVFFKIIDHFYSVHIWTLILLQFSHFYNAFRYCLDDSFCRSRRLFHGFFKRIQENVFRYKHSLHLKVCLLKLSITSNKETKLSHIGEKMYVISWYTKEILRLKLFKIIHSSMTFKQRCC